MTVTHEAPTQFTTLRDLIADTAADLSAANPYWTAGCLADALIRTGQLVLVDDGAVDVDVIVKQALSVATLGTPSEIAVQIAHNAVKATLAALQVKP